MSFPIKRKPGLGALARSKASRNLRRGEPASETLVVLQHLHIRRCTGEKQGFLERPDTACPS
jgi:hypothetical protein